MYHLFKCEAKYLDQIQNGYAYVYELFSLINEGGTYFIIFKIMFDPNLMDDQHVNTLKNNVPSLVWITRPDCYPVLPTVTDLNVI